VKIKINLIVGLIILFIVASSQAISTDPSYAKEIERWRAERLEEINGENGWNTLVGLFWLHEGRNLFGSAPSNEIVLPQNRAPRFAGSLLLNKTKVLLVSNPGAMITRAGKRVSRLNLHTDDNGDPTVLRLGSLTFFMIKRGEKFGLRVKDRLHPARSNFPGLSYFPIDETWRLKGKLEPYLPHKAIPIANVLGMVDEMMSPGAIVFEKDGKTIRLDPVIEKGSKQLFVIFADLTNNKDTYGAGRYLYVDPPGKDGRVIIDFNKAYNPPCAFTKFATCPLPPRQNRLPIRVDAGEKKYAGSEH
jgi:uncharacterized protein (DUF1684 family)